ncbi:MAG: efflux RND transporter periplasmic adaptor subunit, partial [Pseudorhodoplanes sp.]
KSGELMTGSYASVRLQLPQALQAISIPASALIFDQAGLRVAVVGADTRVTLKPVTIARDLGREVELCSGLEVGEGVVDSPPVGIASGDQVRVTSPKGEAKNDAPPPPARKPEG